MECKEEAVSPVIGVILMVAITVILAGIIGVFVFGLADDVQGPKDVALTTFTNSSGTVVVLQGGKDASQLSAMAFKVNGATKDAEVKVNGTTTLANHKKYATGDVFYLDKVKSGDLLISATFKDGAEKVLLQKTLP